MTAEGPDDETVPIQTHAVEPFDAVDVNQARRAGNAQLHHRQEALAARQNLAVGSVSIEKPQGFVKRLRCEIFELCGIHSLSRSIPGGLKASG